MVIGHYFPSDSPNYWKVVNHIIYKFHMPLFLIISGYLYGRSSKFRSFNFSFIKMKFNRLIVPFISIAVFSYIVKFSAGIFFNLQHPVKLNSLFLIFITSEGTYFALLWFVYTLFIIFIIFPNIERILHFKSIIFSFFIFLYFIEWPKLFYLNYVFNSLPYFSFGALFLKDYNFDRLSLNLKIFYLFSGLSFFIIAYIPYNNYIYTSYYSRFLRIILGISGSITVIGLASIINDFNKSFHILKIIGIYSMSIYLLHPLFLGLVRIINYQLLGGTLYLFPAIFAIILGIIAPIIIERNIIRKYPLLRKYVLGNKNPN